jgi:hypothetical protein
VKLLVSGIGESLLGAGLPHLGGMVTPRSRNRPERYADNGMAWCMDNAAFSGFDADAFRLMMRRCAATPGLLFLVAPDVVGDARATHRSYLCWTDKPVLVRALHIWLGDWDALHWRQHSVQARA